MRAIYSSGYANIADATYSVNVGTKTITRTDGQWSLINFGSSTSYNISGITWSYGTGSYVRPYSIKVVYLIKF